MSSESSLWKLLKRPSCATVAAHTWLLSAPGDGAELNSQRLLFGGEAEVRWAQGLWSLMAIVFKGKLDEGNPDRRSIYTADSRCCFITGKFGCRRTGGQQTPKASISQELHKELGYDSEQDRASRDTQM